MSMNEILLPLKKRSEEDEKRALVSWDVFVEEAKKLGYIAGPMVAITLSLGLLNIVSMMMVGHLGELALSSSAIAISLCGVTGFSVLVSLFSLLSFFFF